MDVKILPKAILFDLDDTIISFDGVTGNAWEKTCISFVESEKTSFNAFDLLQKVNKIRNWYWSDPERHRAGRIDLLKARREIVKAALKELDFYDEDKA